MVNTINEIAIIGAGLGGAALALCLSSSFPDCKITIYEYRSASAPALVSSGVILTPNGLAILDKLGVLPLIKDKCYLSTYRCFKDRDDKTTKKTPTALQERYGYSNHRLWRSILLDTMLMILKQRENVSILYEQKLTKIHATSTTSPGVSFDIESLQSHSHSPTPTLHADLLIGADGLYSTVRHSLYPHVDPEYTGTTALITHISRASVSWPLENYELNATIQDIPSAIIFIPEDPDAKTIMVGRQFTHIPSSSITNRSEFDKLQTNKQGLCDLFCQQYDEFGATSRKILDSVKQDPAQIFMWPFMKVPTLSSWYRDDGRVLILGDAAHAIPPSSGQGVNQVLEDVWMFALLLSGDGTRVPELTNEQLLERLRFWQEYRQARTERICGWAMNVLNVGRMGRAEREGLRGEKVSRKGAALVDLVEGDDMAWLYEPCIEEEVRLWLQSRGK